MNNNNILSNFNNFADSIKSYLPKSDPSPLKKDFDNDDYLYLPPPELSKCKKNEKPEKASDFQTNSLCFIRSLIKKIPSVPNKTGTQVNIQLSDNVKARVLDKELSNTYVSQHDKKKVRSQIETYHYLHQKTIK